MRDLEGTASGTMFSEQNTCVFSDGAIWAYDKVHDVAWKVGSWSLLVCIVIKEGKGSWS